MRQLRTVTVMSVVVVLVGACGGDGGSAPPGDGGASATTASSGAAGGTGTDESLEEAARTQFEALLAADNDTYFDLLSASCRDQFGFAAVAGELDGRRFAASLDGVDFEALSVSSVDIDGDGSTANVILVVDGPGGSQFREAVFPHRWVFEDGGWHMDDCADFREAQGGLEGQGMDRSSPLPFGGVADVNGWLISLSWIDHDSEDLVLEFGGEVAADGNQLVTAQVGITYNGGEPSIVVGDEIAFDMVSDATVYGSDTSCETTDSNGLWYDPTVVVAPGETAGNPMICREVAVDDLSSLLLRVTHEPSGQEWWFDLSQPST